MDDISQPFESQIDQMAQNAEQAGASLVESEELTSGWDQSKEQIRDTVIATLEDWLATVRRLMQPIRLRTLRWERIKVARYRGITWRHPAALRERGRNMSYRSKIAGRWLWIYRYRVLAVIAVVFLVLLFAASYSWLSQSGGDLPRALRELLP